MEKIKITGAIMPSGFYVKQDAPAKSQAISNPIIYSCARRDGKRLWVGLLVLLIISGVIHKAMAGPDFLVSPDMVGYMTKLHPGEVFGVEDMQ